MLLCPSRPPGKSGARADLGHGRLVINCCSGGSAEMLSCSASHGDDAMSGSLDWPGVGG